MKRKICMFSLTVLLFAMLISPMHAYGAPGTDTREGTSEGLKQSTLRLANKQTGIALTWTSVSKSASYKIYKKSASGNYILLKSVKAGARRYILDKRVVSGRKYTYKVKAIKGKLSSQSKAKSLMRLAAPGISLEKQKTRVTISWKKVKGASSYTIYKKAGSGAFRKFKTIRVTNKNKTSYTCSDKSVRCRKTYSYAVQARGSGTASTYKNKKKSVIYREHRYGRPHWVEATCHSKGYNTVSCVRCSHRKRYQYTKTVASHVWKNENDNGGWVKTGRNTMKRTCVLCAQTAVRPIKTGSAILDYGVQFIGGKFRLHGDCLTMTSDCEVDCTHFVYYVLKRTGIYDTGYHYSYEWKNLGTAVKKEDAQPGDVIVTDGHCAFYMGGGTVLHAGRQLAYPDGGVRITDYGDSINDALHYFTVDRGMKFLGIRRFT